MNKEMESDSSAVEYQVLKEDREKVDMFESLYRFGEENLYKIEEVVGRNEMGNRFRVLCVPLK